MIAVDEIATGGVERVDLEGFGLVTIRDADIADTAGLDWVIHPIRVAVHIDLASGFCGDFLLQKGSFLQRVPSGRLAGEEALIFLWIIRRACPSVRVLTLSRKDAFRTGGPDPERSIVMSWTSFLRMLMRVNLGAIVVGWAAFWGYGVVLGDVPPASTVPALVLLTGLGCAALSVILLIGCHVMMMVQAARRNGPLVMDRLYMRILGVGLVLVTSGGLGLAVGSNVPDALSASLMIPGVIITGLWSIAALHLAGPRLFRSYFTDAASIAD